MRRKHPDKEDLQYYSLHLGGYSYREIAKIFGVSVRTAWQGVRRARKAKAEKEAADQALADAVASAITAEAEMVRPRREPSWTRDIVVNFGSGPYTPDSPCAHVGPYAQGSMQYCPKCHISGMDDDPGIHIDPRFAPEPEPKPAMTPAEKQSRKQRRKREAAEKSAKKRTPAHAA